VPKVVVGFGPKQRARHFREEAQRILESFATEIVYRESDEPWSEEEKARVLRDAEAYITGWGDGPLTERVIDAAQRLRIVALVGSSVRHLCPEALFARGIHLTNTAKAVGDTVAEFTLGMILAWCHLLPEWDRVTRAGGWRAEYRWPKWDLTGKTVGLIGCGAIGRRVVELLAPFRCKILVADPYLPDEVAAELGVEKVSLERALSEPEIISVHAGSTEETYHMIGREQLDLIKDNAILINTARGAIFDEQALAEKLNEGKIRAALDVFEEEPLPQDSPLRGLPNVLISPHLAAYSEEMLRRVGIAAAEDVKRFFEGKPPLNTVTPEMVKRMT